MNVGAVFLTFLLFCLAEPFKVVGQVAGLLILVGTLTGALPALIYDAYKKMRR